MKTDLPMLATARTISIVTSDDRNRADSLAKTLRAEYNSRAAAVREAVKPLEDHIRQIKTDARLAELESIGRELAAKVAAYDKAQAAARSAMLILQAQSAAPAPVQIEPVKPAATRRTLVIDAVDLAALPVEYHIADEAAVRKAIGIGRPPAGVRYHYEDKPIWGAK